jgi:hypothetical protein
VKLIHFANGFFRALSGRDGSSELLFNAVRSGRHRPTNEQFVRDARAHLEFSSGYEDPDALRPVRTALERTLNQDSAAYGSLRFHSFTASHWQHTSADPSDNRSGRFMAQVLAARSDDATPSGADLVEALRALLRRPDDLYRLTVPFLDSDDEMGPPPDPPAEADAPVRRLTNSPEAPLHALQEAVARLVARADEAEKTAALQRLATLGGFGIFLHLVNATNEALEAGQRVPLLLCKKPPRASMRDASRRTFVLARQRLARTFEEGLAVELRRRGQDDLAPDAYTSLMRDWLVQADMSDAARERATQQLAQFEEDFAAEREGTDDRLDAFVRAAVPTCLESMATGSSSCRPSGCAVRISTHSGLLGPFRGGGEKYYRPAPQFLDLLAAILLQPGEALSSDDFWERAHDRFGLLCGARGRRDAEILREYGVLQASVEHLRENADALHDQLTRLGHARTYADGVTYVEYDAF